MRTQLTNGTTVLNSGDVATAHPIATPGQTAIVRSSVLSAVGEPYTCRAIYVKAGEAIAPGEVVKLDLTSTTTIANAKVLLATEQHNLQAVVGIAPNNIYDVDNKTVLTEIPEGSYFWAITSGIAEVKVDGTVAKEEILMLHSTDGLATGEVADTTYKQGIGLVLVARTGAGLAVARVKVPSGE